MVENAVATERRLRDSLVAVSLLVLLKAALLAYDPTIRFFFGDSASYLYTAFTGWIPPDRSFIYGYFVRFTALASHSMLMLAIAQSALGVLTAWMLYRILRESFAASFAIALGFAVLLVIEPAQLFYERIVMAESAGTTMLVLMFYCGFRYLRKPHWIWPPLWALAGIVAVAFRLSNLPLVLGFSILPVLLALLLGTPSRMRTLVHLAITLAAVTAMHDGYRHLYGHLFGSRPNYIASNGYFRLGLVAPLVTEKEATRVGLPSDLLKEVGPALRDPRTREQQIWYKNGLIPLISRAEGATGERKARKLADRAVRADPVGLVALAYSTLRDYFNSTIVRERINSDVGTRAASDKLVYELEKCCTYDARGVESKNNPVARYFRASTWWLTACLFSLVPLALLAIILNWRRARYPALLLLAISCGMFTSEALFSHIVSFRYLHPFPFAVLLCIGACLAATQGRGMLQHSDVNPDPTRPEQRPGGICD